MVVGPGGRRGYLTYWRIEERERERKREREQGLGTRNHFQSHTSSDLLPPTSLYFQKFPEPSKMAPPAGDQAFNK
jgi:hypothetical protein